MGSRKKNSDSTKDSLGDMVFNINYANEKLLSINDSPSEESPFTAADIYEDSDHVFIDLEVPGVDPGDISMTIKSNVLSVECTKAETKKEEEVFFHCAERNYGKFKRSFGLSGAVDSKSVSCSYKNGILHITIPKMVDRRSPIHKVKIEL